MKYRIIKKFIKGKTGKEVDIGTIIDVDEDRIDSLKKLGIIDKPVREKRIKKKKEY